MPLQAPEPKNFPVFSVGAIRDQILQDWRLELRNQINPDTGQPWSEDEIARAIAPGSRWWIQANGDDQVCLALQQQGLTFADQVRIDRANTVWLRDHHGWQWGMSYRPASGGFGPATNEDPVVAGTIYFGSTTIGDTAAFVVTDPRGKRYQAYQTAVADGSGNVTINFLAIDTGKETNLPTGTIFTPSANIPLGHAGNFSTTDDFTGGVDAETDAEFAARLLERIRNKPGAGNRSQWREWAKEASSSIEEGFVYPCAMHAGSTLIAITQKRSNTVGPLARIPNTAVLSSAISYLVPPGSNVVPGDVLTLVTGVSHLPTDIEIALEMPTNSTAGWRDLNPWPRRLMTGAKVTSVVSPTVFEMSADTAPPTSIPRIMVWDVQTSKFVVLTGIIVSALGGGIYEVEHAAGPVVQVGDYVSPLMGRYSTLQEALEKHFDAMGPGDVVPLDDERAHRAFRYPMTSDEYPARLGRGVLNTLQDVLDGLISDSDLLYKSNTEPPIPVDPTDGPAMLTLGGVGVYPLN